MNNIICISGLINSSINENNGGGYRMDGNGKVTCEKIRKLKQSIGSTINTWNNLDTFTDPIVSIRYRRIVPKSLRMSKLFKAKGIPVEKTIVGASFDTTDKTHRHVIVYLLPLDVLFTAITMLESIDKILIDCFDGCLKTKTYSILANSKNRSPEELDFRKRMLAEIEKHGMFQTDFINLIQDIFYIDDVYINTSTVLSDPSDMLITFYDIGLEPEELLSKLELSRNTQYIGNKGEGISYYLTPSQVKSIMNRYPYLVSMSCTKDLNDVKMEDIISKKECNMSIPNPTNEPVIGVIDGDFDHSAYFAEWVEHVNSSLFDKEDTRHGTAVSSLIVDGPSLNPDLEDGCGRFKVKLFSFSGHDDKINQFELYQYIESIVNSNPSIKVWNLSLGSIEEIDRNSISPLAALLDRMQNEKDVIFVVSGTNNEKVDKHRPYIGAPADSINSIVVNAISKDGKIPSYARKGPVLDFYLCPDLCAVGGTVEDPIKVCTGKGISTTSGTSYATCWVTRKLAYLIHYMNCTKEEAKAILIDSAYGWSSAPDKDWDVLGCGILPHHINDILHTPNDEVKLVVKGYCKKYRTYSFDINVPLDKDGNFPYLTKATLCYFPKTSRKQGVDYAQTEIDLHFGRLEGDLKLRPINRNKQGDEGNIIISEDTARHEFRKWDCVKHISEGIKEKARPRKVLYKQRKDSKTDQPWGFYLLKKKRSSNIEDDPNFAMVITFKSIDKKNRFNDFLRIARYTGWYTRELDIDVMNEIYVEGQIELDFD